MMGGGVVGVPLAFVCLMPLFSLAAVTINNNGYYGIEIAIHKEVPEDLQLLETLKVVVNSSSALLYKLTNKRAYFHEVTIILPSTWSYKQEYKKVPEGDYFPTANVRVASPHPSYNHTPYTFQPGRCGELGRYIHFTPEFILNYPPDGTYCKNCDELAKVFVHEWLHLRYGVFDEYGSSDNPNYSMFYLKYGSWVYANACPASTKGYVRQIGNGNQACTIDRNGNIIGNCVFQPVWTPTPGVNSKASIMYMPQLQYADHICEDDNQNGIQHNIYAPNEHNYKCGQRSVRNVIESSPDFVNGRNPARDIVSPYPTITVVHPYTDRYPGFVLVLDVSSSMQGKPMQQLIDAASRAIKYKTQEACPVGMVKFSSSSTILAQLTSINANTRNELLSKIPKSAAGYTAIGQGLLSALQVLKDGNKPPEKGKIVLITDGEENVAPNIAAVTPQLVDAKVIVYGLAFGDKATTKIEDLCYETGGKGWSYNADHLTQSLDSMLDEIFQNCGPLEERPVINRNEAFKLLGGNTKTGMFHVDKNGIESVSFTISYNRVASVPSVTITSPNEVVYTSNSPQYKSDPALKTIVIHIDVAESGKWTYNVTNTDNGDIVVSMMITSERGNATGDTIRVNSWINDVNVNYPSVPLVYVELKKGLFPVLNANVIAKVLKPNGDVVNVTLKDNGIGADTNANDGIYTGYYTRYNGNGRYALDILVDNNQSAVVPVSLPSVQSGSPNRIYFPSDADLGTPVSSFLLTDLEQVDEEFNHTSLYRSDSVDNTETNNVYEKIENFERFSTAGTFILHQWKNQDLIPPAKITDLKVKSYDVANRTVMLQWTSPGDNMTDGQASSFELRYHQNLTTLLQFFNDAFDDFIILNGTLEPPEPFQLHNIHLELPIHDEVSADNTSSEAFYFAVRTLDANNNVAELSNVAFVSFYVHPKSGCGHLTCMSSWSLLLLLMMMIRYLLMP